MSGIKKLIKDKYPGRLLGSLEYIEKDDNYITIKYSHFFQRCAEIFVNQKIQWVELSLLVIAALIGFLAFIATIAICCFYSKYKRLMRKHAPVKIIEAPVRAYIPTSLPPGSIHGGPSIAGSGECCMPH